MASNPVDLADWTEDPDVRAAYDWFEEIIGHDSWMHRRAKIEKYLDRAFANRSRPIPLTDPSCRVLFEKDLFAWYMYLADAYLTNPLGYEFEQGARVIPVFKALGRALDQLETIQGIRARARRLSVTTSSDPDGHIFEILVALAYKRNGWNHVALIPESNNRRTPDIIVKNGKVQWLVECKRMAKDSSYSRNERLKWLRMYPLLGQYLAACRRSLIIDIVFHVELDMLDDHFLADNLLPKLDLICCPCLLVDNNVWTVHIDFVDYAKVKQRLRECNVKLYSASMRELIMKESDSRRGYTLMVLGAPSKIAKTYISDIQFAAGVVWSCDAESTVQKKARYIRRQLAKATRQLPKGHPGVVHIGLESLDGIEVERERYKRIVDTVINFDATPKNLQWVYCHIFDPRVPPDKCWDFGETVYYFGRENPLPEPLQWRSVVLPPSVEVHDGADWI